MMRTQLITVVPASAEQRIVEAMQAALSINERSEAGVTFQVIDRIGSWQDGGSTALLESVFVEPRFPAQAQYV